MGKKKLQGADGMNFQLQLTIKGLESINLPEENLTNESGNDIMKISCWGGKLSAYVNLPNAIRPNNVQPFQLSDCIKIELVRNQVIEHMRSYLQKHLKDKYSDEFLSMMSVTKMECNLTIKCVGDCKPKDVIRLFERSFANEIYGKLQSKLQDMVAENAFVYDRMNNRVEEIRNRGYDYANEQDDTQAVQSKALQLMSQMPKVMNSNHANRITKVLTDSINSGVIGSKAVLELLKYPAYADMVSAKIRERAFEGSKSSAEQAFDRLKESELKEAEQGLASVYMQGFHLRNIEKQVNAFKKPSAWNPDEQTA